MNKHRQHVGGLVALVVAAVVIAAGFLIWQALEDRASQALEDQAPAVSSAEALPEADYELDGRRYRLRPDLQTILLIGHDKNPEEARTGFRDGGQADFLLLLVVDDSRETVRMLQIDRDTWTRVHSIGVTGRPSGGRDMQICLAHAFGDNVTTNDLNTRRAVVDFLGGGGPVRIDYTVSMYMDGISRINSLLGGVIVTVPEDLTSVDPAFTAGATLRLTDEQAFNFCHARMGAGDGRNTSRMQRQKLFMESAAKTVQSRVKESGSFANTLVDSMMSLTNMLDSNGTRAGNGWFINQLKKAATYSVENPVILPGEHDVDDDTGFVRCFVKPEDALRWVVENLCYEVGGV